MTIFNPGDKVRRSSAGDATVYKVEERTGDQYRVTVGEGDALRTRFFRGFELVAAASDEDEKPEVAAEPGRSLDNLDQALSDVSSHALPADREVER